MANWIKFSEITPPLNKPIILKITETLESAKDKNWQLKEDIEIKYATTGFRTENGLEIIIPRTPEENIDNIWEKGISYVLTEYNKNNDKYLVGKSGVSDSRWLSIKEWKEVTYED